MLSLQWNHLGAVTVLWQSPLIRQITPVKTCCPAIRKRTIFYIANARARVSRGGGFDFLLLPVLSLFSLPTASILVNQKAHTEKNGCNNTVNQTKEPFTITYFLKSMSVLNHVLVNVTCFEGHHSYHRSGLFGPVELSGPIQGPCRPSCSGP